MIELKQYQYCIKNPKFQVNGGVNESLVSEIIMYEEINIDPKDRVFANQENSEHIGVVHELEVIPEILGV